MARVSGPLFSAAMRGVLGDLLSFRRGKTATEVRATPGRRSIDSDGMPRIRQCFREAKQ
jgi:hypothetical protein